jgi:putative FmdB family regulatory protein
MPIYEYECSKCGHHTEALQKFSDPPLKQCEQCHGSLKKVISQSTFHLKGTGWYVTDYASKSRPTEDTKSKKDTKTSSAEAKSSPDSPKKSDSKKT